MLSYPSIVNTKDFPFIGEECLSFYKYDGSNLRFEFNPRKGWHKFGSRTQLIDANHSVFGIGWELFNDTIGPEIVKNVLSKNTVRITAFCEFFGENSFAGNHIASDEKQLKLFDVYMNNNNQPIDPYKFVSIFSAYDFCASLEKRTILTPEYIENIRRNTILQEGVICKGVKDDRVWMTKIKTNLFLQKLKDKIGHGWEKFGE